MLKDEVLGALSQYPDIEELQNEGYEPRGILPSEMAVVVALARAYDIELFIESGRARGQSTKIIAKYLPEVEVHSFELHRDDDAAYAEEALAGFSNLTLHYGDARESIPALLARRRGKRAAVLIDGPKGKGALRLMHDCVRASKSVVLGFIHDMHKEETSVPVARSLAEASFTNRFFSDDNDYVSRTGRLDHAVAADPSFDWSPHRIGTKALASYGPTIVAFAFGASDYRRPFDIQYLLRRAKFALRRRGRALFGRRSHRWPSAF